MLQYAGGNGKSVTLKVPCLLLLALRGLGLGRLCACLFEVLQVNTFRLLCLKLIESNNHRCKEIYTPRPRNPNSGAEKDPQSVSASFEFGLLIWNRKHWKRSGSSNWNYFSSCVPSCWATPSCSQPNWHVSPLCSTISPTSPTFYSLALFHIVFLPLFVPSISLIFLSHSCPVSICLHTIPRVTHLCKM